MAEPGIDQKTQAFFKGLVQSAAEARTTKAVRAQTQTVVQTIGGHVREVLGPLSEVVDLAKATFSNVIEFFKGIFADVGKFFGFFTAKEPVTNKVAKDIGDKQLSTSEGIKEILDSMADSQSALFSIGTEQLDTSRGIKELLASMTDKQRALFEDLIDKTEKSNKLAEKSASQKKQEMLQESRMKTVIKKGALGILDLLLVPFALISGILVGFIGGRIKMIVAPFWLVFKAIQGVGKLLLKPFRAIRGFLKGADIAEDAISPLKRFRDVLKRIKGLKIVRTILAPFRAIMGIFRSLVKLPFFRTFFRIGKFIGGKLLLPVITIIDFFRGLTKFREIFGETAGFKEAIIAGVAGIINGLIEIPLRVVDWVMGKVFDVETDLASKVSIENIATGITNIMDMVGGWIETIKGLASKFTNWLKEKFDKALMILGFKKSPEEERFEKKVAEGKISPVAGIGLGEVDIGGPPTKKAEEIREQDAMNIATMTDKQHIETLNQAEKHHEERKTLLQKILESLQGGKAKQDMSLAVQNVTTGAGGTIPQGQEPKEMVSAPGITMQNTQ